MAALLPCAVIAQGLPPLPPLPPLPGMEAPPPAETPKAEAPPPAPAEAEPANTSEPAVAEVPQMPPLPVPPSEGEGDMFAAPEPPAPSEDDFALPDFGLFDPSALPSPPPPQGTEIAETEATPSTPSELEPPQLPAVAEAPQPPAAPEADSQIADILEAPSLPALPALPGFDAEPEAPTEVTKKEENGSAPDMAGLAPPELPKDKPIDAALADALPSWMTDETLPSLKPLPQDREVATDEESPAKPTKKASAESSSDIEESLADLIDKEIRSGDSYAEDEDASIADLDIAGDTDEKRVVWPKNFKTQRLPPQIYRKQYSNANRHLPHAVYQKEIEAHLFGAVGANDADAVRALLRTGVPITIKNTMGEDLVMHAVKAYATTTLQLLLALGAQASQQDRYGATPLHRAVFMGRQDMVTILLRAGADSYVADMSGVTPMSIAVARRDQPMMQTLGYYQSSDYSNQRRMAKYQPY